MPLLLTIMLFAAVGGIASALLPEAIEGAGAAGAHRIGLALAEALSHQ